jgi:hypothetical protein
MIDVAAFMITIGFLRFRVDRRHRKRVGRQSEAGQDVHVVPRDELLCEALGDVGCGTSRVPLNELDLPPAERVAMKLEVRLHPVDDLGAVVGKRPGEFRDDADLDGRLLRQRAGCDSGRHDHQRCFNIIIHLFIRYYLVFG